MKKKIKNIINGWKNTLITNDYVEEISQYRLTICNECPKKQDTFGIDVCGECGCPLMSKTRSLESKCPLNKW
jgi:hypothetical protein